MIRKFVLGSGMLSFMPKVNAATPVDQTTEPKKPPEMRPSDLPIYEAPHADYGEYMETKAKENKVNYAKALLNEPVRSVRENVQEVLKHTDHLKNNIGDNYNEFRDRTDWLVQYLREEENKDIRIGAVVMGGLTGFIFGLRGGYIKRLLYTTIGTTAMCAVCFPEDTKDLALSNKDLFKQYTNIAYNFLYGVKPGDPQLEVKFPELSVPKNVSECVDLIGSMASSIKQAVMPPPPKEDIPAENKEKKQ